MIHHTAELWRAYDAPLKSDDAEIERAGFHVGKIAPDPARSAAEVLLAQRREEFRADDAHPGHYTIWLTPDVERELNETCGYIVFGPTAHWAVADLLDAMRDDVAEALGSPWRTINVRAWTTKPASESGPYRWHTDGYLDQIFKIMLYLTPVGEPAGGISLQAGGEVITPQWDSPGLWVLFKNTAINHRGISGKSVERLAVEVTLCRSSTFDTRPRYAGLNAHFPVRPDYDVLDGCPAKTAREFGAVTLRNEKPPIGIKAVVAALAVLARLAPIGERLPIVSRRFAALRRHAEGGSLYQVAERIYQILRGRGF